MKIREKRTSQKKSDTIVSKMSMRLNISHSPIIFVFNFRKQGLKSAEGDRDIVVIFLILF